MLKYFISLCLFTFTAGMASAQQNPLAGFDRTQPVSLQAQELMVDQQKGEAVFKGQVVAEQDSLTLRADHVHVTFTPQGQGKKQEIEQVHAKGEPVTILMNDTTTVSNEAIYDIASNSMDLIGDVTLTQGENVITGERMTYNLTTGRVQMGGKEGAGPNRGGRVSARLKFDDE